VGVKARRWLEGKGLRFIAANVRGRGGEIDLIMKDGQTTVFVEVRFGSHRNLAVLPPA
jgi:putative endonuclease